VSPILIRPVREQLEHDRLIRFLLINKYKRRLEVVGNIGEEHHASVKIGNNLFFPDIVIIDGKKLGGIVEVETGESVNNLEALAQWTHFGKIRVPFHLYVPVMSYDSARRLCELHHVRPTEIWTYRSAMDGFDFVRAQQNPVSSQGRMALVERVLPKPKPVELPVEKPPVVLPVSKKPGVAAAPVKGSKVPPPPPVPVKPGKAVPPAKVAVAAKPALPAKPVVPAKPAQATKSAQPTKPAAAVKPAQSTKAAAPVRGAKPSKPSKPAKSAKPVKTQKAKPHKSAKKKR
jgi:hypothetical protein